MKKKISKTQELKKQSMIYEGKFRDYLDLIEVRQANNLHNCTNFIGISGEKLTRFNACGSPYCPICRYYKVIPKIAQFYKIYDYLVGEKTLENYKFYHMTLTMELCEVSDVNNATNKLKEGLNQFLEILEKFITGCAINVHYKIKDEDLIKPHYHLVLMVDSANDHIGSIIEKRWQLLWKKCLGVTYYPDVDLRPVGTNGNITPEEFSNVLSYGFKHIKDEDIEQHLTTYLKLMREIFGTRKTSYRGNLRFLKALIIDEYNSNNNQPNNEPMEIRKFDGKKFKKARVLTPNI